jgi:hypothetical protein
MLHFKLSRIGIKPMKIEKGVEVSRQHHALVTSSPEKTPLRPFDRRLCGPQRQCERVFE